MVCCCFFFQAEDGIRDLTVTGVQTCALPILTNELEDVCMKASKAVGGGILGVDIMEDEKRGLVVHEINNTVEFKGLSKVSKKNIPKEMIDFAIKQAIK